MSALRFAITPKPPYYIVSFTSQRTPADDAGYDRMADLMVELGSAMPGFLGVESTRDAEGFGITLSYWASEAAILAWREQATHILAQETGKNRWYAQYEVRVAKIERAYSGPQGRAR